MDMRRDMRRMEGAMNPLQSSAIYILTMAQIIELLGGLIISGYVVAALGALLHRCLVGVPPFDGKDADAILAQVEQAAAKGYRTVAVARDEGEGWRVDTDKPATWRKGRKLDATNEVFTFLDQAIRQGATLGGVRIIAAKGKQWAELALDNETFLESAQVRDQATLLRELIQGANLTLEVVALHLPDGQRLLDLTRELKETPTRYEVTQG